MAEPGSLETGRDAVVRQAWGDAYRDLSEADAATPLELDDLERLALSAHMVGRPDETARAWERSYHAAVAHGQPARAVHDAFHLMMGLGQRGEFAKAGAWHARATGILDAGGLDVVERGYLYIPEALMALQSGDPGDAFELFERVAALAERFGDPDLATFGRLGRGQCLVALGEAQRGVAFLDEAMLAVATGEVSPITVGTVYCAAIEAFGELFDLRRAQEWTAALSALVRCPARPRAVSRQVPGVPDRDHASSTASGSMPTGRRSARMPGCRDRRSSRPSARRTTGAPSSIDCAVTGPRPRRTIARPAAGAARPTRACPAPSRPGRRRRRRGIDPPGAR